MRDGYPLVELHRHLDGNVRVGTVFDLARQHGLDLPAWTVEGLRPHVQVMGREAGLMLFIAKFGLVRRVIADYDAVRRIVRENLEDAAGEGIDYIELRGIDLAHEYRIASEELGLSGAEIHRMQENALEAAFLTPGERTELLAALGYPQSLH